MCWVLWDWSSVARGILGALGAHLSPGMWVVSQTWQLDSRLVHAEIQTHTHTHTQPSAPTLNSFYSELSPIPSALQVQGCIGFWVENIIGPIHFILPKINDLPLQIVGWFFFFVFISKEQLSCWLDSFIFEIHCDSRSFSFLKNKHEHNVTCLFFDFHIIR